MDLDADLDAVERLASTERGLAVVTTLRSDATAQASVVNAGLLRHPVRATRCVAFVSRGGAVKLANLRRHPRATLVFRRGPQWVAVEGTVDLIGPDDRADGFDPAGLPQLLRDVFVACGGTHDDWDTYDRVMREERRTAVLVSPQRVYGVGG